MSVIDRFVALGPLITKHAQAAEASGRLQPPVVDALVEAGIARLFLPRSLGGLEVDPVTCAQVTATLARFDSAAAWYVMVANSARLMAATWPERLVEALWLDTPDALISASGNRPLQGTAKGDGYVVSGVNGFVSGANSARWFMTPFVCDDGRRFIAVLSMADCTIVDSWDALGMRGTDSQDVQVTDLFVSPEWVVELTETPGKHNKYYDGVLYQCPGRILFATYVPITLVLAERALAELSELAQAKTPASGTSKLKHQSHAQIKYARALATQRSAKLYFEDALDEAFKRATRGEIASPQDKADLYLAGTHAVQSSADVVRAVADAAGTSVVYKSSPLERICRDMETLRHHGFANESRYGSVTQLYWGAELDYPLLLR